MSRESDRSLEKETHGNRKAGLLLLLAVLAVVAALIVLLTFISK